MRARLASTVVAAGCAAALVAATARETPPGAAAWRVAEPLTEARPFANGALASSFDEFGGPALTPDGRSCFFTMSVPHSQLYTILLSRYSSGRWGAPEVAPFSGRYLDFDPTTSPDGRTLVFASDRPASGNGPRKQDFDLWRAERRGDAWGEPVPFGPEINGAADEEFGALAANGNLYFSSDRAGEKTGLDLYVARLVNGKYAAPERLPAEINTEAWEFDVAVAPDESFLLFTAVGRPDSKGSFDIYVSFAREGGWTPAQGLGPEVNGAARDYSPRLSPDGRYLFFSSERGFLSRGRTSPLTYEDMEASARSVASGLGNLYQIELAPLLEKARAARR